MAFHRPQRRTYQAMPLCAIPTLVALLTPLPAFAQTNAAPMAGFRLERVLTIGGDNASADAAFMDIAGIAVTPQGHMYVLDAGHRSVRVFDPRGRVLRRFGRQGGGPGEFQLPVAIWVDTVVGVVDLAQQRMSHFTTDGRHLRTEPVPTLDEVPVVRLTPLRYGRAVGQTPSRMGVSGGGAVREGSPYVALVVLSRGARPDTLLRMHSGVSAFHPRDAPVPFGTVSSHMGWGGAHAVLGDSVVATADGYSGTVRWYRVERNGLALFRTRELPSRSRALTRDDVRRIERRVRSQGGDIPRRLVIEAPPRVSIASQALFSDRGFLWIRNTADPDLPHVWTVFAPDGEIAYRLSLPAGFHLRHIRGDLLYGSAKSANDAALVRVYRLRRS
jgi:hypothetical protein